MFELNEKSHFFICIYRKNLSNLFIVQNNTKAAMNQTAWLYNFRYYF